MRLRQAAALARRSGALPLLAKRLRAIAGDPIADELELEGRAAAARIAREAATARAATEIPETASPARPPSSNRVPRDPDAVDWMTKRW